MKNLLNGRLPYLLLPSPADILRNKRKEFKNVIVKTISEIEELEYKIHNLNEFGKYYRAKYVRVDKELAEIDGRLKKAKDLKLAKYAEATKKKKASEENKFTQDQISVIAAACGISLGEE